ncbi:hypothetical protein PQ469_14360 [Mucilaginibacter sp. KACC 22773]|uniref:hypothetical protein n=1 Tax=Mucilaginibacter sp. KACC 22773 TaxID=3025671 RepID=UPI0023661E89|nr:hypothetical protein [Mucilaginibacter sp. KACC 22773]WDF81191.1 hypothetical protein PQ469_14360 [Mucilaginibacter sp. KACC 22773]
MKNAILKTDGTAVNIDGFSEPIVFDTDGFLVRFFDAATYRYHQTADFRDEHKARGGLEGYYLEQAFLKYIQYSPIDNVSIELILTKYKYDFSKIRANIGDTITISRIDYGAPYEYYYREKKYTFSLAAGPDNKRVKNYKKAVYEDVKVVDYEIDVPAGLAGETYENDQNHSFYGGYFFWKNFGSIVNGWTINDTEKRRFKKITTAIALKINYIIREILPLIVDANSMSVIDSMANDPSYNLNDLTDVQKAVFILKRSWGHYYHPESSLIQQNSFDAVFSSPANYTEYWTYYTGLANFYDVCYALQDDLMDQDESEKLNYLIRFLPAISISVFPFVVLKYLLEVMCNYKALGYKDEDFIIKLAAGITVADSDAFLDFLLEKQDGITTRFETLYKLLEDNILSRMLIPSWLIEEQTYRKCFVYAVYRSWLTSKYNLTYLPTGAVPILRSLNPMAYFIQNISQFNRNNVLTFTSKDSTDGTTPVHTDIKFSSTFDGAGLKINKITETTEYFESEGVASSYTTSTPVFFGRFHLYQVISLTGFQANLEFSIPQKSTIPAFLFHYVQEYDELAAFDAKVALGINIAVELALFFVSGGFGLLEDLSYLRYFTKVGQALEGALPAEEAVEVWRGLEAGSQVVSLSAATLTHFQTYLLYDEHDVKKRAMLEKIQKVFLSILFLSATVAGVTGAQAVKSATEALDLLPSVPANTLTDEMEALLRRIKGDGPVTTAQFGNDLNHLDLQGATNYILAKYIPLSDKQQLAFWEAFKSTSEEAWRVLNQGEGFAIQNWLSLFNNGIDEAKIIDFITNQALVDAILRFYDSDNLKDILQVVSYDTRVQFLKEYGSVIQLDDVVFERIAEYPNGIQLLFDVLKPARTGKDIYTSANALEILRSSLEDAAVGTLVQRNKLGIWDYVTKNFIKLVKIEGLAKDEVIELSELYVDSLPLAGDAQIEFKLSNRLFVTQDIYQDGLSIQLNIKENFFSGDAERENLIFNSSISIKNDFIETDFEDFEIFGRKAIDNSSTPRPRINDTELKFALNFLKKHYNRGNRFDITFTSVIAPCTSCQRYLQALVLQAKLDGKILNIKFIAHPDVNSIKDITRL